MKKILIAGNWKMHTTPQEARELAQKIADGNPQNAVLCPPTTSIAAVAEITNGTAIGLGAQNCHFETKGAFTGEVSPAMLVACGCTHVIIGHSERRTLFGETDELIAKKVWAALGAGLTPLFCVGETLYERQSDRWKEVIERQLKTVFTDANPEAAGKIVVAYEPVWAIGTGLAATPEQAEEVHVFIRTCLHNLIGNPASDMLILYGGSVNEGNARTLLSQPNINGALVGGASLKPESFLAICAAGL